MAIPTDTIKPIKIKPRLQRTVFRVIIKASLELNKNLKLSSPTHLLFMILSIKPLLVMWQSLKATTFPNTGMQKNRINQSAPGKTIKRKIQLSLKVFENLFIISSLFYFDIHLKIPFQTFDNDYIISILLFAGQVKLLIIEKTPQIILCGVLF